MFFLKGFLSRIMPTPYCEIASSELYFIILIVSQEPNVVLFLIRFSFNWPIVLLKKFLIHIFKESNSSVGLIILPSQNSSPPVLPAYFSYFKNYLFYFDYLIHKFIIFSKMLDCSALVFTLWQIRIWYSLHELYPLHHTRASLKLYLHSIINIITLIRSMFITYYYIYVC